MGERYKDYRDLAACLREYSDQRKGEISKLTWDAAHAIEELIGKLEEMEDDRR